MKTIALILVLVFPVWSEEGIRVVSWPTPPASTNAATIKTVSVSTASVTLLTERAQRLKVTLFNEKETLYIKAGTGASITDYTWRMPLATTLEITTYTGPITAVLGVTGPTTVHVTDF